MNLIANRHLNGAQKQVIYELTLKKRQSKKSTMSEKQRAAKQQLARELMLERKILPSVGSSLCSQLTIDSQAASAASTGDSISHADQQSLLNELLPAGRSFLQTAAAGVTCQACCPNKNPSNSINSSHLMQQTASSTARTQQQQQQQQRQQQQQIATRFKGEPNFDGSNSSRLSCASCSFSRSDSSYSGSSASITTADSNRSQRHNAHQQHDSSHLLIENEGDHHHDPYAEARKKQTSIKIHKLKLEHLNLELEQRLHQYEYLVAQEKALLGTYNLMLFTNQGVNNFHLHHT